MRLSDYIISRIYALGTDTLFSVSGRGILFLTDAVAKHKKINNIATHHEQAAGFSAVAYDSLFRLCSSIICINLLDFERNH